MTAGSSEHLQGSGDVTAPGLREVEGREDGSVVGRVLRRIVSWYCLGRYVVQTTDPSIFDRYQGKEDEI